MDNASSESKDEKIKGRELINEIFSWSLSDVCNENLYNVQVKEIPNTFSNIDHYMNSFKLPLIEETHVDLSSNMKRVAHAPVRQIRSLEPSKFYKSNKDLLYGISLKNLSESESDENQSEPDIFDPKNENDESIYEPEIGDLIALTNVRPNCINDLNRPEWPYLIAYVCSLWDDEPGQIRILSSKSLSLFSFKTKEEEEDGQLSPLDEEGVEKDDHVRELEDGQQVFAVYLTNLTTNIRIWQALTSELEWKNYDIIREVLAAKSFVSNNAYNAYRS